MLGLVDGLVLGDGDELVEVLGELLGELDGDPLGDVLGDEDGETPPRFSRM